MLTPLHTSWLHNWHGLYYYECVLKRNQRRISTTINFGINPHSVWTYVNFWMVPLWLNKWQCAIFNLYSSRILQHYPQHQTTVTHRPTGVVFSPSNVMLTSLLTCPRPWSALVQIQMEVGFWEVQPWHAEVLSSTAITDWRKWTVHFRTWYSESRRNLCIFLCRQYGASFYSIWWTFLLNPWTTDFVGKLSLVRLCSYWRTVISKAILLSYVTLKLILANNKWVFPFRVYKCVRILRI